LIEYNIDIKPLIKGPIMKKELTEEDIDDILSELELDD
jgi:hypothetical protein